MPWVGVPVIYFFNLGQAMEASVTNIGFLLMLALHLKRNIMQLKTEHQRLIDSELRLQNWNERLQQEVDNRTRELEKINAEVRFNENCQLYRLLKGHNIILLIEDEHSFFIVNGVDCAEGNRTIMIAQQNSITQDAGCSFIPIGEGLYVGDQHQGQ